MSVYIQLAKEILIAAGLPDPEKQIACLLKRHVHGEKYSVYSRLKYYHTDTLGNVANPKWYQQILTDKIETHKKLFEGTNEELFPVSKPLHEYPCGVAGCGKPSSVCQGMGEERKYFCEPCYRTLFPEDNDWLDDLNEPWLDERTIPPTPCASGTHKWIWERTAQQEEYEICKTCRTPKGACGT